MEQPSFSFPEKKSEEPISNSGISLAENPHQASLALRASLLEMMQSEKDIYTETIIELRKALKSSEFVAAKYHQSLEELVNQILPPWQLLNWPTAPSEANKLRLQLLENVQELKKDAPLFINLNKLCQQILEINSQLQEEQRAESLTNYFRAILEGYQQYQELLCHVTREQREASLSAKTSVIGEMGCCYLTSEAAAAILGAKVNETGRHEVTYFHGIHFKPEPDSPGTEYAVDSLNKLLCDQGSTPSTLLKLIAPNKTMAIQASKTVSGITLDHILQEPGVHQYYASRLMLPLDAENFSATVLFNMLINPYDGKKDNFVVEKIPFLQQTTDDNVTIPAFYKLVCVDNDLAFTDAVIQRNDGKHITNVRCVLFFFAQMDQTIHPRVRARFLALSPELKLIEWLFLITRKQKDYLQLAKDCRTSANLPTII